jgi:hypothetical protein
MVYFGGFFAKLGYFAGFSPNIIYIVKRISATAIAGDIIFFSLGSTVGHFTGAHSVMFRGIFSIYYSPDGTSEAEVGGAGVGGGGHYIFDDAE